MIIIVEPSRSTRKQQTLIVVASIILGLFIGSAVLEQRPATTERSSVPTYQRFQAENGLIPNVSTKFYGTTVRLPMSRVEINRYGFRDSLYRKNPPANTIRIAVLGDSYTFGWGVNASQTYSAVLERQLNNNASRRVEVLNFGVPDANTRNEVNALRNRWIEFSPDLVIIGFAYNDIINKSERDRLQEMLYRIHGGRDSMTEDQTRSIIEQASIQYWEQFSKDSFASQKPLLLQPLQRLHELSEREGFNVLIYVFSGTGGTQLRSEKQYQLLENLSQQYGWALLSSEPIRDQYSGQKLGHHPLDTHPTAFYHTQVATQLHTYIENHPCLLAPAHPCTYN